MWGYNRSFFFFFFQFVQTYSLLNVFVFSAQVKVFVTGLFSLNQDIPAFKEHLRDFLVQIKEFAGEDTTDLFLEERETSLRQAQEEKHKLQMSVPGILNPHELPEEMCD